MITTEQMEQADREFATAATNAVVAARKAERALERQHYGQNDGLKDPSKTAELAAAYDAADYMAESRAWILDLIRKHRAAEART